MTEQGHMCMSLVTATALEQSSAVLPQRQICSFGFKRAGRSRVSVLGLDAEQEGKGRI